MKRLLAVACFALSLSAASRAADWVDTKAGPVSGTTEADGLRVHKGSPSAAPPVGPLRWQAPQPAPHWTEVKPATAFGAQGMQ